MSENTLEVVADQLRAVENLGPLSRLVFAITQRGIGDPDNDPYSADVVNVVVPTEILRAITAKISSAGPPLRAVQGPHGLELVAGGRDVACVGKC
jgi:hypothetical protein